MYERDEREPSIELIHKFADFFNVSVDYLLGRTDTPEIFLPPDAEPIDPDRLVRLPVLGKIAAGEPIDRIENIEGYELVEPELLRGRKGFILRVQGNSMTGDRIYDGDRVVVVVQETVQPHDIAVVAVNGEYATLKRVKFQGDMCILTSSNPEFEPIIVPAKDVHIIGKVVEVRHRIG
ncbi:MAG: LexA family transcriptional regulator [Bacillota bacterium]|nr:MAG: LexA family transcriptional regulator [Bacillota bacterium]